MSRAPSGNRRIPRSFMRRAVYSFLLIAIVVVIGILGMHALEGMSYLDAFYFISMLATGEGPSFTPATVGGKVFASLMAFVSVGTTITALLFLFGPFFGRILRVGVEKIEEVEKEIEHRRDKETEESSG